MNHLDIHLVTKAILKVGYYEVDYGELLGIIEGHVSIYSERIHTLRLTHSRLLISLYQIDKIYLKLGSLLTSNDFLPSGWASVLQEKSKLGWIGVTPISTPILKSISRLIRNNKEIKASHYQRYNSKNRESRSPDPLLGEKYTLFTERQVPKEVVGFLCGTLKGLPKE